MKIVIVTGSSTGIGKDAAQFLAHKGFTVLAGVRKEKDFSVFSSANITPFLLDVTSESSAARALETLKEKLSNAEVVHLVNNAGAAVGGPIESVPLARWQSLFDVNVFGLVRATQTFLPHIRRTRGRIVNISSVSGLATLPYLGPYSASKFAVEAISDALRRELRQFGVKVVAIEPGPVRTPIWEKGMASKEEFTKDMSPECAAIYKQELSSFIRAVEKSKNDAVPVARVSEVIHRALTRTNPRTRYIVGGRSIFLQGLLGSLLPDRWMDFLISTRIK